MVKDESSWVYVAWIRNLDVDSDDQDDEYPATVLIRGPSADAARAWGDSMYAEALTPDTRHELVRSELHRADDPLYADSTFAETPTCRVGERVPAKLLW
ncbi:MAG TPA: hypothetical protein DDW52_19640 [Planctomycetaceae bacterium]|nr:hypothetical protein [Planctomycetaceae bacterium]